MEGGSGKRFPAKLKDLLATGILEGLKVRYVKGQKARKPGEKDLQGVIKDAGILCFCGSCKGNQVVSPNVFELHADSANRRPPEYTYLENGKLLRDVMNACSSLPLDTLDKVVQMVLGDFPMQNSNICFNCRGSISESNKGESKLVCNPCMELKESKTSQLQPRSKKKREEGPKTTSAETSSQKRKGRPPGSGGGRFTERIVSPITPAQTLGSSVHGTIDGKFDDGYIVTVDLGSEQLKGVLYHVSSNASKDSSIGGLSEEKVER
ncbi:uncharacterized protein [Medicago truncatula]|uniref:uncharacterized protein n=1 Tax=Medicago truncatula TaxID=3880 RepID=UPI001966FE28|nr:uncharacterized protein LOC25487456 [Medicago truncatula]